jgi:hypothetical protein
MKLAAKDLREDRIGRSWHDIVCSDCGIKICQGCFPFSTALCVGCTTKRTKELEPNENVLENK